MDHRLGAMFWIERLRSNSYHAIYIVLNFEWGKIEFNLEFINDWIADSKLIIQFPSRQHDKQRQTTRHRSSGFNQQSAIKFEKTLSVKAASFKFFHLPVTEHI